MTLRQIVNSYGFVVHVDEELGLVFAWNGFATLNVLVDHTDGDYRSRDCFTSYDMTTPELARQEALSYCQNF